MFNNPNQHNMMQNNMAPIMTQMSPAVQPGVPTMFGQPIPTQQYATTYKEVVESNYVYAPGAYEIILDKDYVDCFIINSLKSRSLSEKYTEAISRITYFFESQKGAQCENRFKTDSGALYVSITVKYPKKYRMPIDSVTEKYPVALYSADNFLKDLDQLKEIIQEAKRQQGR